jgi:hypothetical protein
MFLKVHAFDEACLALRDEDYGGNVSITDTHTIISSSEKPAYRPSITAAEQGEHLSCPWVFRIFKSHRVCHEAHQYQTFYSDGKVIWQLTFLTLHAAQAGPALFLFPSCVAS